MNDKLKELLKLYASEKDYVKAIYYLDYKNMNSYFNRIITIVDVVKIYQLEEDLKSIFSDVVLTNRKKDSFKCQDKRQNYTKIKVFSKSYNEIENSIIQEEYANEYLNHLEEKPVIVVDKKDYLKDIDQEKKIYENPKDYEFRNCIRNFFTNVLETCYATVQRDKILASIKLQNVRYELLKMTNWYIIDRYSNAKDIGEDGEFLKNTLIKEYKDMIFNTFTDTDILNIYDALFSACTTFRKMGLLLEQHLGYEYLKKEDVEIIKILRANYKEISSLIG
ncbi:MAG: aminoglycoside 6-adenylyltransferase [Tissierellia bacterium]|nr:aminoglycoside 6-adenylyltransferase [Tissierellia bacterium]